MAWTTPPTFAAGTVLTAANLNILSDDLVYLYGISQGVTASGAGVTRATTQSISDSSTTSITWTAESFDFGGWWSSGTDIIVPAGAIPSGYTTILVAIVADLQWASNATGYRAISIYKDGSLVTTRNASALSGDTTQVGVTFYLEVAAAAVITIRGTQTSGGALNVTKANCQVIRHAPAS